MFEFLKKKTDESTNAVNEKMLIATVDDLFEKYLDNTDGEYDNDELYHQIEKIYLENPTIESIADNYTWLFAYEYEYQNDGLARQAIEFLERVNKQFVDSISIAENYSGLLQNIAGNCGPDLCKECFSIIKELGQKYSSQDIEKGIKKIEESVGINDSYEEVSLIINDIEQELKKNSCSEIAMDYINHLVELVKFCDVEEAYEAKDKIASCAHLVNNEKWLLLKLMEVNTELIPYVEDDDTKALFVETKNQFERLSTEKSAELYAKSLIDLACRQNELLEEVFDEIRKLYFLYTNNLIVQEMMAVGLTCIEYIQSEQERKRTSEELLLLAKKHPNNAELQEVVKDAYRPLGAFGDGFDDKACSEIQFSKSTIMSEDCFAVLDTETNWQDEVMSIGLVIADKKTYRPVKMAYYIIKPAYLSGGMYSNVINTRNDLVGEVCSRDEAIRRINGLFSGYGVSAIYAYNATFDQRYLPELGQYKWFDIMLLAANKNSNPFIPDTLECCKNGRLKKGYGAEAIIRIISGSDKYSELHNALFDAIDELKIMQYLRHDLNSYQSNNEIYENEDCIRRDGINGNSFEVGDRIYNKAFGHGIITSISLFGQEKYQAKVVFVNVGEKNIMLPYPQANIKIL